jgi:hypothetical protein
MWLFGDRVDSSEIPSDRFTDWPDELARVGYETFGVIWLRLTPDGGLHLEHEDNRTAYRPQDWIWSLQADRLDQLLEVLELERTDSTELLAQVADRLRTLTPAQMQERFKSSGAELRRRGEDAEETKVWR